MCEYCGVVGKPGTTGMSGTDLISAARSALETMENTAFIEHVVGEDDD